MARGAREETRMGIKVKGEDNFKESVTAVTNVAGGNVRLGQD